MSTVGSARRTSRSASVGPRRRGGTAHRWRGGRSCCSGSRESGTRCSSSATPPLVVRRGGRVRATVLTGPGRAFFSPAAWVSSKSSPTIVQILPFDIHVPLMSLPGVLGATLATVPADVPYIRVGDERRRSWRQQLARLPRIGIGMAWQGNPRHPDDRKRSIALQTAWQTSRAYNCSACRRAWEPNSSSRPVPFPVMDLCSDLGLETAAVIQNLDLVITMITAIAHLAGALAARVWVALAALRTFAGCWTGRTAPGIPPCGCSGKVRRAAGRRSLHAWRGSQQAHRCEPDMIPIAQTLQLAVQQQRAGNLRQAESLYRQVLEVDPRLAHVHDDLRHRAQETGPARRGDRLLSAISPLGGFDPNYPLAHNNLGIALLDRGGWKRRKMACVRQSGCGRTTQRLTPTSGSSS